MKPHCAGASEGLKDSLKDLMALARCPSARDAEHRHDQHKFLEWDLMEKLVNEPYFQED